MEFVDIFAGMGTIRMGMEMAGHKCVYSIEWDKWKRKIYSIIFGGEPDGCDIRSVRAADIPRAGGWWFGFPCTDISNAGPRTGLGGDRSKMFFEVMRLLEEKEESERPEYLFIENVDDLLSINGGWDFLRLLFELDALGYDAEWEVIDSAQVIPQHRERVYIVGHLRGRSTRKVFPIRKNDQTLNKREKATKAPVVRTLTAGGNSGGLHSGMTAIIVQRPRGNNKGGYHSVAPTLTSSCYEYNNHLVANGTVRRLTPREFWRLQGVPDSVTDKVIAAGISPTQMYRAAGDACTVIVINRIAQQVI